MDCIIQREWFTSKDAQNFCKEIEFHYPFANGLDPIQYLKEAMRIVSRVGNIPYKQYQDQFI